MEQHTQRGPADAHPAPENPSAEIRELDEVLAHLGRVLPRFASFDGAEPRRRCLDVLEGLARQSTSSLRLATLLEGTAYFVGGDEHHVFRSPEHPRRVFKITHGDNFGCRSYFSPHDPELTGRHFHGTGNSDPFFYLERWRLLNSSGGYQTRFEGFVPAEKPGWLPRICISQPELDGENPTRREIREALGQYGFHEISEDAFLDFETGLLLTDVAPRNIRIVERIPVPFDAITQMAAPRILEWASTRR